ncbi:beta-D-glucosyl crocetin beta-1,6-glucosyltransferase, partial [Tanacetum coccineum]
LTDLPSELHFTNGLPVHLMPILKQAFDMSSLWFLEVLEDLSPDLLIYYILQSWAPAVAAGLGIPSVVFITTSVIASMYHFELNAPKDDWLDIKAIGSTAFVSFESEGEIDLSEALLSCFFNKVRDMALVVKGWAPQSKILGHKNIRGFVTHCGWSLALEDMKFLVLIISMPMHLDQPINARLVVEVGVILEVVRVKGRRTSHNVAEVV